MNQIYPTNSLVNILLRIANGDFAMTLFTNSLTVSDATVLTDLTFGGLLYTAVPASSFTLTGTSGGAGFITASPVGVQNDLITTLTAYGYALLDSSHTNLILAANFDVPQTWLASAYIFVVPTLGMSSQY